MVTSRYPLIFCLLLIWLTPVSCASPVKKSLGRDPGLSVDEQNVKMLDALQEISRLSPDYRKHMFPQIEAKYIELINKYPDSQWAYECYNRLMLVYLSEYDPPEFGKAEAVRARFMKQYVDSSAGSLLDDTLADAYYRSEEWTKLIKLYTTSIKRFIDLWNVIRPRDMFLYAEAKFHLGDMEEARKGYNIITFYFPNSPESMPAKNRLEEIAGRPQNTYSPGPGGRPVNRVRTIEPALTTPQEPPVTVNSLAEDPSLKVLTPENPVAEKSTEVKKPPAPDLTERSLYSVQLGFFGNEKNARSLSERLKTKGYDVFVLTHTSEDKKIFYRVLSGRFQDKSEALEFAGILHRRENIKSILFKQVLD